MSQTQTRRSSQVDLLHGPILKSLLLFALPIMASRVFQQIYEPLRGRLQPSRRAERGFFRRGAATE